MVVLKYAIPGTHIRLEFTIRLPRCVVYNRSYQPENTQDRWNVGLMFLYNGYEGLQEPCHWWPKQTYNVLHRYGTEPRPVYLNLTNGGGYVAAITKWRWSVSNSSSVPPPIMFD